MGLSNKFLEKYPSMEVLSVIDLIVLRNDAMDCNDFKFIKDIDEELKYQHAQMYEGN